MKKLKVLFGALALIASMALVGCNQPTGGTGNNGLTGGAEETTSTPTEDLVLFEGNEVINASGYDAVINFTNPVAAGSGYKKFKVEASWESADGIQCQAQMKNAEGAQSSATISLDKNGAVVTGACLVGAKYDDWSTGSAVPTNCADGISQIQFYIQNSSYATTTGTVTVKKIWLVAE